MITKVITKKKVVKNDIIKEQVKENDINIVMNSIKLKIPENKYECQIMNKDINMDLYSHNISKINKIFMKSWKFVKDDSFYSIEYSYGYKTPYYSKNATSVKYLVDEWYLKNIFENKYIRIYNINDWIKDHIKLIKEYEINYKDLNNKFELIKNTCLGEFSFDNVYSTGWCVKNEYIITIIKYKYPNEISVTFKNITKIMNIENLLVFIEKNTKKIINIKKNALIKQQISIPKLKKNELSKVSKNTLEPVGKDTACINIMKSKTGIGIDNKRLYEKNKTSLLFITNPLYKRLEIQTCKKIDKLDTLYIINEMNKLPTV